MTGVTFSPDAIGASCALLAAVLLSCWFVRHVDTTLDAIETDTRRTARVPDSEIDHTYVSGGE